MQCNRLVCFIIVRCLPALLQAHIAVAQSATNVTTSVAEPTTGGTASNVTDKLASASSCNAEKYSWISASGTTFVSNSTFTTVTTSVDLEHPSWTNYFTTETLASNTTPYTLCDGWPRINGSTSFYQYSTFRTTQTYTSTIVTTSAVHASLSIPTCSIPPAECAQMNSSFWSSYSVYSSWIDAYETAITPVATIEEPTSPICGSPTLPTALLGDPVCFVFYASMSLLYWPITTISGDLCKQNGSTVTAAAATTDGPVTYVGSGTTFTSPTVYMALEGTYVHSPSGGAGVSTNSQLFIPMSSTAVRSLCGLPNATYNSDIGLYVAFGPPQTVNYENFDYPVPASAYRCQPKCFTYPDEKQMSSTYSKYATTNLCSTIWDDYAPALAVPKEFSSMNPGVVFGPNVTCDFDFNPANVFYDPPRALRPADSVQGPTAPAAPTPNPAIDGSPPATPPSALSAVTAPLTSVAIQSPPAATAMPDTEPSSDADDLAELTSVMPEPQPVGQVAVSSSTRDIALIIASVLGMSQPAPGASSIPAVSEIPNDNQGTPTAVIQPGSAPVTVSGAVISLATSSSYYVIDGTTHTLATSLDSSIDAPLVATIAGNTITANAESQFALEDGQALFPGGPAVSVSGAVYSLAGSGALLVEDGTTISLAAGSGQATGEYYIGLTTVDGTVRTTVFHGEQTSMPSTTGSGTAHKSATEVSGVAVPSASAGAKAAEHSILLGAIATIVCLFLATP